MPCGGVQSCTASWDTLAMDAATLLRHHDPTPQQLDAVEALLDAYTDRGLLPLEQDEPLYDVCPNRESCWQGAARPPAERAGLSVPWVGREYTKWRICVVGLNFNNYGGLEAHWRVCESHVRAMSDGKDGKNGRFFARGAMSYARAVELSMSRALAQGWDGEPPQALARSWHRCAFLQAVKCAPVGNRSRPTRHMCSTCPPYLLADEIEILAPRVVILLGRTQLRDVVRPMLPVAWGESPGSFERDRFQLRDGSVAELLSCNHPSCHRNNWRACLSRLVESLRAAPLATSDAS